MVKNKKIFNVHSFTVFIVTCFFVATLTGIVLSIVPNGRIANGTDWSLLGLQKGEWANIHLAFTAVFIVGGITHLYLNW